MCGIFGYLGHQEALPILVEGLRRLEYRGYDSTGVAVNDGNSIQTYKTVGRVADLKAILPAEVRGSLGIAHTRWATHGPPTDRNSHPHLSCDGKIAVVHNGIVENFAALKTKLEGLGYKMQSDTDTELIAHLIYDVRKKKAMPLEEAVRQALTQVHGAFGLGVVSSDDPDILIGARRGSPLILGIGEDFERFVKARDDQIVAPRRLIDRAMRSDGLEKGIGIL